MFEILLPFHLQQSNIYKSFITQIKDLICQSMVDIIIIIIIE